MGARGWVDDRPVTWRRVALVAAVIVTYAVVHGSLKSGGKTTTSMVVTSTSSTTVRTKASPHHSSSSVYVVKPGDSLSTISVKTGVSVATLESLNPRADPNALQAGERLTLRK